MRRRLAKPAGLLLRLFRLEPVHLAMTLAPPAVDGWYRSVRESMPVDREGRPLPWYSYPAIEFLARRCAGTPPHSVFEYGCGNSTLWWAERAASVVSVEHDETWHRRIASLVPSNVELRLVSRSSADEYANALTSTGRRFDVVVIDGRNRVACAEVAVDGLTPGGVIVFDNCERTEYANAYRILADRGLKRVEFTGMAPIVPDKITTCVYYRESNFLGL